MILYVCVRVGVKGHVHIKVLVWVYVGVRVPCCVHCVIAYVHLTSSKSNSMNHLSSCLVMAGVLQGDAIHEVVKCVCVRVWGCGC